MTRKKTVTPGKALPSDTTAAFEKLARLSSRRRHYDLRLYVTGSTPRSAEAIANLRALCDEYLANHYRLEIVDIYQQPAAAFDEQIIAAPTLVKNKPKPIQRLIGDLSNRERVVSALHLKRKGAQAASPNRKS